MMPELDPTKLAEWTGGEWRPAPPARIDGVSNNTRALLRGSLYIALRGERFDGHDFVDDAFHRGAAGAVVAAGSNIEPYPDRPLLLVHDTEQALGAMAARYRGEVDPLIVGVTGSAGKSTVKEMTACMLSRQGVTARTQGNWNNQIGLPLSLMAMPGNARYGVFEVGMNHPGETSALCELLQPDWGIVTNVGPAHIGFFESLETIAQEKADLLRSLPADGRAVLDRDGDFFETLRAAAPCEVVTVSLRGNADYVAEAAGFREGACAITEHASGESHRVALPLPGTHNLANALQAAALARSAGVDWEGIEHALDTFQGLAMRWETQDVAGLTVVNDAYNANPMGMRAAIRTFSESGGLQHKWLVLGDMLELGEHADDEHRKLGVFAAQWDWAGLLAVGPLGTTLAQAARDSGLAAARVRRCGDSLVAGEILAREAQPGDAVLLKGSRRMKLEKAIEVILTKRSGSG